MTYETLMHYLPNLLIILGVFTVGVASPGPATLMIISTAMSQGRLAALALSLGIVSGSLFWATLAALGFVAALAASAALFSALKLLGALYLLYLAFKSLRSATRAHHQEQKQSQPSVNLKTHVIKGLLLHLTNPKAPLVWIATLSIGLGDAAPISFLLTAIGLCAVVASGVFIGYAMLFSTPMAARFYTKTRRPFEAIIGLLFGGAALKILTLRAN